MTVAGNVTLTAAWKERLTPGGTVDVRRPLRLMAKPPGAEATPRQTILNFRRTPFAVVVQAGGDLSVKDLTLKGAPSWWTLY